MKDDDSKLIWEKFKAQPGSALDGMLDPADFGMDDDLNHIDGDSEEFSNKFRGPGSPGVQHAKGYLLQAMELIDDEDVHLCADREALETTIGALKKAIQALSQDMEDVPGEL